LLAPGYWHPTLVSKQSQLSHVSLSFGDIRGSSENACIPTFCIFQFSFCILDGSAQRKHRQSLVPLNGRRRSLALNVEELKK
jgi:hypothetical protein